MGRVVETSLGDLKDSAEDDAFRKFSFKVEEIAGPQCLTQFYGMSLTTDKLRSLVRKWHSLIEAHADVKTTDGYTVRLFCIGFTRRRPNQRRVTSYAQSAQERAIRKKMVDLMTKEGSAGDLNELINKLMIETIGREIEKATQGIYPLQNVHIRKAKVVRSPKFDIGKLMENHGGADAVAAAITASGKKLDREDEEKGKKKRVKGKKAKDPNAPKRPLSAFMYFSQEMRSSVKTENPDATFGELGKLLAEKWGNTGDKKKWEELAKKDKARYEKEKEAANKE